MAGKPTSIDLRKGVHIKLYPQTQHELRVIALRAGVSMQEIMEEFAQRLVRGETYPSRLVEQVAKAKREKLIRELSQTDAESIFDFIELQDPFSSGEEKDNDSENEDDSDAKA